MNTAKSTLLCIILCAISLPVTSQVQQRPVSAPIFIDPYNQGSCDPEIVWNSSQKKWYIYYTVPDTPDI